MTAVMERSVLDYVNMVDAIIRRFAIEGCQVEKNLTRLFAAAGVPAEIQELVGENIRAAVEAHDYDSYNESDPVCKWPGRLVTPSCWQCPRYSR